MYRWLSHGFFLVSIVMFGLAGYCYFAPAPGTSLEIAETDMEVAGSSAGKEMDVAVGVHNHSSQPLRILGLAEC